MAMMTIFAALTLQTWRQVGFWCNTVTLFEHSLQVTGINFYGNNILWTAKREIQIEDLFRSGLKLAREGNLAAAASKFSDVIALDPNNARAHYNRGLALEAGGNYADALQSFDNSIQLSPNFKEAQSKSRECRDLLDQDKYRIKK